MAKQSVNVPAAKTSEKPNVTSATNEQRNEVKPANEPADTPSANPGRGFLKTLGHVVGYAYVPFQSKWFAHGATELANMILHGHPAPVYDNGSIFGQPNDSEKEPKQLSANPQLGNREQNKQSNAAVPNVDAVGHELISSAAMATVKSEIAPPVMSESASECSVEQRMQEILSMETTSSMQQQPQIGH